ncbi:MAG: TMEM175 family protein [Steroidobacter sp.]
MSHHESAAKGADARMVDRMLFFSDAVFAIVLTLLALDLRPVTGHDADDLSVSQILGPIWEHLFVFLISFIVVGQWWMIHLRAMRQLQQFDIPTAVLNLFFLLCITLMPFASTIFASNFDSSTTLMLYWGELLVSALSMTALFLMMSRDHGKLIGGINTGERIWRASKSLIPAIAFLWGVIAALIHQIGWSRWCWVIINPLRAFDGLLYRYTRKIKMTV